MLAPMQHERIFVAMGGNLGDVVATMQRAVQAIHAWPSTAVVATSSLYRTRPVDAEGDDFVNAVIELRSDLAPEALLDALLTLEATLGRQRLGSSEASQSPAPGKRLHAARTIDLDLLAYGHQRMQRPRLTLPHPRLHQRAFVLKPWADIAPAWRLADGRRVDDALAALPDADDPVALDPNA